MKCVFKHQYLQMFALKLNDMRNFTPLGRFQQYNSAEKGYVLYCTHIWSHAATYRLEQKQYRPSGKNVAEITNESEDTKDSESTKESESMSEYVISVPKVTRLAYNTSSRVGQSARECGIGFYCIYDNL